MGIFKDLLGKLRGRELDKKEYYQAIFHESNWAKATVNGRLEVLQKLENEHAGQQGRAPYEVIAIKMDFIEMVGNCDFLSQKIEINKDYLTNTSHEHITKVVKLYMVVDTIIHEGRHAYQAAAIRQPRIHSDQAEVQRWKENNVVYYGADKLAAYRFQPLEQDANDFAQGKLEKLYKQLEAKYGENKGYDAYVKFKEKSDELFTDLAKKEYGENFVRNINSEIHREYLKIQSRERKGKDMDERMREILRAPDAKKLQNDTPSKTLYNAYAKEAVSRTGGVWQQENTDREICLQMMKDGRSSQRIQDAMRHSPAMEGMSGTERTVKALGVVREVGKTPEAKNLNQDKGLERS